MSCSKIWGKKTERSSAIQPQAIPPGKCVDTSPSTKIIHKPPQHPGSKTIPPLQILPSLVQPYAPVRFPHCSFLSPSFPAEFRHDIFCIHHNTVLCFTNIYIEFLISTLQSRSEIMHNSIYSCYRMLTVALMFGRIGVLADNRFVHGWQGPGIDVLRSVGCGWIALSSGFPNETKIQWVLPPLGNRHIGIKQHTHCRMNRLLIALEIRIWGRTQNVRELTFN